MNDQISFGISYFNGHAIIKINCKLNDTERARLQQFYPKAEIHQLPNGLTRINAVMPTEDYNYHFLFHYKLAIARTKYAELGEHISGMVDTHQRIVENANMGAL